MPRKHRVEEEGGLYHVINRGNYRQWVFESEGAKVGFEKALFESCARANWVLHAYVIMGNHFHLALETPRGGLSEGMRWLQSVFANRFNRIRRETGRLFQGRFKSLHVEPGGSLAALSHYVHLNPVRAGICSVEELKDYRWSSSWYWRRKSKRPEFLDLSSCLEGAGRLRDTPAGWRSYERYLAWLAENRPEQKRLLFNSMSRGWALGTEEFKRGLVERNERDRSGMRLDQKEAKAARLIRWEERLGQCLKLLRRDHDCALRDPKSAAWKVAVAAHLKEQLLCSNVWLAEKLNMGVLHGVSRYVGIMKNGGNPEARQHYEKLNAKIKE